MLAMMLPLVFPFLSLLPSATALPSPALALAPPPTFTANPSIGSGTGSYKDSPHFRVYASDSNTDAALKMLEAAYACFVDGLGWRSPGVSWKGDVEKGPWWKVNVFSVADGLGGAAGQTWTDTGVGVAYLKILKSYLTNPSITVHEFGHALTYSEKNWLDQSRTGAWWETIANFIADTYIATPTCASAKSAQAISPTPGDSLIDLPKLIGDSYQVLVDATTGSGNYYQAWPFLSYITNNPDTYPGLGPDTLKNMIRKYSLNSNETPLHSLARLLSTAGGSGAVTIQQVVTRYWARMAWVDIGHAKAQAMFTSQRKNLNYKNLDANGGGKWTVKSARAPRYMGASIIPLTRSASSSSSVVSVTVSASSGGSFAAVLAVRASSGAVRYVDLVNGVGNASLVAGEEAVLVVVNVPKSLVLYDAFNLSAEVNKGLGFSVQVTGATA